MALVVSVAANLYLANQNTALNAQNTGAQARIDMIATLTQAQTSITVELERIGASLVYASKQLSTTGLVGDQADAVLVALAANSSFIIMLQPRSWTHITPKIMEVAKLKTAEKPRRQPERLQRILGSKST